MIPMKAAVVRPGSSSFAIEDVLLEEPRPDEILVKMISTGVCHTDMSIASAVSSPQVLGHEGAGIVERIGEAVAGFNRGDKVVLSFASCAICDKCLSGAPAHCRRFLEENMLGERTDGSTSIQGISGENIRGNFFGQSSFAEYALVKSRNLVKLPAMISDDLHKMLGPLGCGIQTGAGGVMNSLRAHPGSSIVIFGAGGVGLSAVLAAVVSGCTKIIVTDLNEDRLNLALKLGATHVLHAADPELVRAVQTITDGGADYSLETSGNMQAVRSSVRVLDIGGTSGLIGLGRPGSEAVIDHSILGFGRKIIGIVEGDSVPQKFIPALIDLHLAGKFAFEKFIQFYPFEHIQGAVDDSLSGTTIKGIVVFRDSVTAGSVAGLGE